MAERTKLESYVVFSFVNTIVYCIPAHWMWSPVGWLHQLGATDVAGASTVHLVGGTTGLVATLMLGPRSTRFTDETGEKHVEIRKMSSPTNAIFGMFMLWWGWLGFNCGSTYGITDTKWILAARSATATITASIAGGITGISLSYILKKRKFDVVFLINGVLGSLVAITAMCALARPWQGIIIGAVGALIACLGGPLCEKLKIDDPVGVVPVHGMASIWSLIAVGIFGEYDELSGTFIKHNGLIAGGKDGFFLLGVQLLAATCIIAWTAITAFITLKILDITIGLRVPLHEEILGADLVEHSLNGTYDKTTSEWRDREGHLIMIVKQYENESSLELLNRINAQAAGCTQCERFGSTIRRRTAFGFSRSDDTVSHASVASDAMPQFMDTDKEIEDEEGITSPETDSLSNNNRKKRRSHQNQRNLFRKLSRTFSNGSTRRSGTYSLDSSPVRLPNGALNMVQVQL
ncbi:putative ammonium transporter 3 isoform X2 [Amphiura filiformis]|uniref:putative ammonium transporter 3 isoform X2 n=1 Tax=Amphiura filiformis TaxID=82378 RepID=UPI003B210A4F